MLGGVLERVPMPAAAIVLVVILLIIVVFAVSRCAAAPASTESAASESLAAAQSSEAASSTAAPSVEATGASWTAAAGLPAVTAQGTDPTAEAAALEAERISANRAEGYEGVEDPWVEGGMFTTGDQQLDQAVKAFCDQNTLPDLSQQDNAFKVFCAVGWSDYVEWEGNQYPRTYDWTVRYGLDFFERGGNCFSMAAANQWCMRYMGYSDAHAEIVYEAHKSGAWLDHGLVWVTDLADGTWKMCDSEMGGDGWMLDADLYSVEWLDPTSDWEPRSSAYEISDMVLR